MPEEAKVNWRKEKRKLKAWREAKLITALENDKTNQRDSEDGTSEPPPAVGKRAKMEPSESSGRGRPWTVSIAVPGSILANAQSQELKAYLAGQIGRAAAIFCVDEIIVFDEKSQLTEAAVAVNDLSEPNLHLCHLLEYLECPQYLRKSLFALSPALRFAGLMNPLDAPHHMRADDLSLPYREAVITDRQGKYGSLANGGLRRDISTNRSLDAGLRVTLKMQLKQTETPSSPFGKKLRAEIVSPDCPRKDEGLYWGYRVRLARSFSAVFQDCPFGPKYDLVIGTSERGTPLSKAAKHFQFQHLLVVFGGLPGLEAAMENDESFPATGAETVFNYYLNTCMGQGSRTIRTEEAVLITLAALKPKLRPRIVS